MSAGEGKMMQPKLDVECAEKVHLKKENELHYMSKMGKEIFC